MRIASLSPAATEILFMLGIGADIVCVDQFSNFPEEAKTLPRVRGHQKISAEALRTYAPELILTGTVIQQKLSEELKAAGFGVVHQDPRTISAVYEAIRQLGAILERTAEAEDLILKMQQGFNAVKKKSAIFAAGTNARPRIYIEEWHRPPMASGNWVPEVIRIAGGEPFPIGPVGALHATPLSREVTFQEVEKFDPDLIVISWCGAGALADKKILLERERWGNLRAIKEGHVRVIDDSLLNRPGPRLLEGAQRMYAWLFERMCS